ncbi:MAG TPA: hypothetical protein VJ827_08955 [Rubrobacter sp.]|nr:hypothetical protein [Rubrobacter sp.]
MRTRIKVLLATAAMLAMMLATAGMASADPVRVGDVVAGPISDFVTVAGFSPIEQGPTGNAPFGTDLAAAGNPVPPNPFAVGANLPFEVNAAIGGVGPVENDVVAESRFFGGDFTQARLGNLSADTE